MVEVRFDEWPLVITTSRDRVERGDVDLMMASYEKAFARGGRFVSVVDATALTAVPTPVDRQRYGEWRKRHFEDLRRHLVAVAMALGDRPLLRGGMTALGWLSGHPAPQAYFNTITEARAWAFEKLEEDFRR